MRFHARITLDTAVANEADRSGFAAIQETLSQQTPEAADFVPLDGQRTISLI